MRVWRFMMIRLLMIGAASMYIMLAGSGVHAYRGPYTNFGNGIVLDTKTSLFWFSCPVGSSHASNCSSGVPTVWDWWNAASLCDADGRGGRYWRLPSINELSSIVSRDRATPSVDQAGFPGNHSLIFWTSTTYIASGGPDAWTVEFAHGSHGVANKSSGQYVRCVSGP